jgi:Flp pilus assembly pilin Flp
MTSVASSSLDTSGSVFVEYVVVLSLVSVGAVAALVTLGVPLLNLFLYQQAVLLLPFP